MKIGLGKVDASASKATLMKNIIKTDKTDSLKSDIMTSWVLYLYGILKSQNI